MSLLVHTKAHSISAFTESCFTEPRAYGLLKNRSQRSYAINSAHKINPDDGPNQSPSDFSKYI